MDKPLVSLNFKDELKFKIRELPANPFKYKQSLYFDDKNIRDMTYKTYTIIIFNKNKPL
jgi:hypothetical protein